MRALLLINAKARLTKQYEGQIASALTSVGVTILETSAQSPENFEELIRRFRTKIDGVIVAGGDGSCLAIAKVLLRENLPLGILPLGTANNLARGLAIPLSLSEAAKVIHSGNIRKIDVGLVNGHPFLSVSGMGLSTQVNRKISPDLKKRWGIFSYLIYLFKVVRRSRRFTAEIVADGKTHRLRAIQVTICNGKFYGSGLVIDEQASLDDGLLDVSSSHFETWWRGLATIPQIWRGGYKETPGLKVLTAKQLSITTSPPMVIDADGEIVGRTPALYEIMPSALCVFAPN